MKKPELLKASKELWKSRKEWLAKNADNISVMKDSHVSGVTKYGAKNGADMALLRQSFTESFPPQRLEALIESLYTAGETKVAFNLEYFGNGLWIN